MSSKYTLVSLIILSSFFAGCRSFDAKQERMDHTKEYGERLARLEAEYLGRPLSLNDCIKIALENSFDVKYAEIDKELGRLAQTMSFSAFLPQMNAKFSYLSNKEDPLTTSKKYDSGSIGLAMPIFAPSTWFLYSAARHNKASAVISENYVKQSITLSVTQKYIDVMVQGDLINALAIQLESAKELRQRIEGLNKEGMAKDWEFEQARLMESEKQVSLDKEKRALMLLKGTLLEVMGVAPNAKIEISREIDEVNIPDGNLENHILFALENHPELSIADRMVVASDDRVKAAFCNFLPTISISASASFTGNEVPTGLPGENFLLSLSAVEDLFKGFYNSSYYKKSKLEQARTKYEREQTFLKIILGVMSAETYIEDAKSGYSIAEQSYNTAKIKYDDYNARSREGLTPLHEALDAKADMDMAQVQLVQSKYQVRQAIENLRLAMGIIDYNKKYIEKVEIK